MAGKLELCLYINPQADDLTTSIFQSDINKDSDVEFGTQKETERKDQAPPQQWREANCCRGHIG